jgi:hypothetical protein
MFQPEGIYNSMNSLAPTRRRLQPSDSGSNLKEDPSPFVLQHQLEGGYKPLSFPHPITLKYNVDQLSLPLSLILPLSLSMPLSLPLALSLSLPLSFSLSLPLSLPLPLLLSMSLSHHPINYHQPTKTCTIPCINYVPTYMHQS